MGIMYAADYGVVCDGATETSGTLQQAITLAANNKVALQLPGGTCIIRTGMSVPTKSHMIGAPNGELYWDTPQAGTHVVLDVAEQSTETLIEGVRIRSTNTTATVNATYSSNYPIRLNRVSGSVIRNCHVQDFWGAAGILLGPGATAANHSDSNVIEHNSLVRGSAYGIVITSGYSNRILGNHLEDTDLGLNNGGAGFTLQNTFAGNIVYGVLRTNLFLNVNGLATDFYNSFTGNLLINARVTAAANFVLGTLANNVIKGSATAVVAQAPISLVGANAAVLTGNVVDAAAYTAAFSTGFGAITCATCVQTTLANNLVLNATAANGIGLSNASLVLLKDNTIAYNGANGIELSGTNADVTIEGNAIYDNNAANNAAYFGINLNGAGAAVAVRTKVQSNRVYSPAGTKQGIPLNFATDDNSTIVGNILYPRQNAAAWAVTAQTNASFSLNRVGSDALCGNMTWTAAATAVVTNNNAKNTHITLIPTNASAALMVSGATSPYVSAVTAWTSFTLATQSAGAAAGTETFAYCLTD